jgi:D-alanyl-D-alanine carboxypeptidase (penicillin-binding protein 5/6)
MFVEVGKQVSVENLVQGMIVQSGNDATVALAEHVAGTEPTFVQMMNTYAKELGMTGSNFTNTPGMPDPEHYTTARDAAILSSALIHEFPEYYRWYAQREFSWNGITQQNRNGLLWRDPSVDGVKTGHTESAGYCLVASAKRDGMRLVSAVLGTESMRAREDANAALLNYGFNFFETKRLYAAGEPLTTAPVWKGATRTVGLTHDGPADRQGQHRRGRRDHRDARTLPVRGGSGGRVLQARDRHRAAVVPLKWPSPTRPAT